MSSRDKAPQLRDKRYGSKLRRVIWTPGAGQGEHPGHNGVSKAPEGCVRLQHAGTPHTKEAEAVGATV